MRVASLLPHVAHRQWTLSLPFSLRFLVVKRPLLLKRLEVRLVRSVWRWQRSTARRLGMSGPLRGGAVVFTQWFGSSLQLTPHLHALVAEAQWATGGTVVHLPPPSDDAVAAILARVLRQAKKDFAEADAAWPEDEYETGQLQCLQRPLGLPLPPTPRRRRVAVAQGFSLHADTAVHANDRQGLERLARYGARGPVAESRLKALADGRYQYTPKKGVSFTLTAHQLVRRLVSLVPPAKTHLTCFHGVYAPHAALRPLVTAPPPPVTNRVGYAALVQGDWEPVQGLHVMLTAESAHDGKQRGPSFGAWLSAAWYFFSHFELRLDNVLRRLDATQPLSYALVLQLHLFL